MSSLTLALRLSSALMKTPAMLANSSPCAGARCSCNRRGAPSAGFWKVDDRADDLVGEAQPAVYDADQHEDQARRRFHEKRATLRTPAFMSPDRQAEEEEQARTTKP